MGPCSEALGQFPDGPVRTTVRRTAEVRALPLCASTLVIVGN